MKKNAKQRAWDLHNEEIMAIPRKCLALELASPVVVVAVAPKHQAVGSKIYFSPNGKITKVLPLFAKFGQAWRVPEKAGRPEVSLAIEVTKP